MDVVRIILDGDRQLVELPEKYRLAGEEVRIQRQGRGIVLEPLESFDLSWLDRLPTLDEEALRCFEEAAADDPVAPDNPDLDHFR